MRTNWKLCFKHCAAQRRRYTPAHARESTSAQTSRPRWSHAYSLEKTERRRKARLCEVSQELGGGLPQVKLLRNKMISVQLSGFAIKLLTNFLAKKGLVYCVHCNCKSNEILLLLSSQNTLSVHTYEFSRRSESDHVGNLTVLVHREWGRR